MREFMNIITEGPQESPPTLICTALCRVSLGKVHKDQLTAVYFKTYFDTREEADAFTAAQPKALRFKANTGNYDGRIRHQVSTTISLSPTKNNPDNEAGITRIRKILARYPVEDNPEAGSHNLGSVTDVIAFIG